MAKKLYGWGHGNDWVLDLVPLNDESVISGSLSNGNVHIYSLEKYSMVNKFRAHDLSVAKLRKIDETRLLSCGTDAVKAWDVRTDNSRPVQTFLSPKNLPFLSVTSGYGQVVGGTELVGQDAAIYIWDERNGQQVRSIVETQHDDVTDLNFHPSNSQMILSGSTDGCINVYNLAEAEEDEALHQVINFSSVASAGWLSDNRIYSVLHMSTFGIHELSDISNQESVELTKEKDFGDIREKWGCEYVIDVYDEYVGVGSVSGKNEVKLLEFRKEKVRKPIAILQEPHGDEIARCLQVLKNGKILSGGEDGNINLWEVVKGEEKKHKSKSGKKSSSHSSKHRFKPY